MMQGQRFDIIVIGGGHAGAEAAWAAANLDARVALISMDLAKTGAMSCNPAIGGLAKGQMVREIDALGGLMGLATDATGIQFRMLNASKGPAVWGPRAQCDKHRYAREVQRLLASRTQITLIAGTVERLLAERGRVTSLQIRNAQSEIQHCFADAVVLTTGTFMRGLMHTGEKKTEGGRIGENAAVGISAALRELGFELGRLKTGTPPRLAAETIDFASLEIQPGDDEPVPFSDLTGAAAPGLSRFPVLEQRPCWITHTNETIHQLIRANLHRAPMYNGQIETSGPRYCPSIEDKVVRFADRSSHHIYLEPESLDTNEIYCNGISTSLPADVQEFIVRHLPGCERARILRYGYAVEYDMVWPHQIDATCMTKRVEGLFLAGQINGTSGYEEAAGQGLIAGLNAVRYARGQTLVRLRRDQAYIGVMLDDLVTKTPREPYRMFTSRAEYRLLLRADNADERLTPLGRELGLVDDARWAVYRQKQAALQALRQALAERKLMDWARRPEVDAQAMMKALEPSPLGRGRGEGLSGLLGPTNPEQTDHPAISEIPSPQPSPKGRGGKSRLFARIVADIQYAGYIQRQGREVEKLAAQEQIRLPADYDYERLTGLRREARQVLSKFKPTTLGQAGRLAGVTPADLMLLTVSIGR